MPRFIEVMPGTNDQKNSALQALKEAREQREQESVQSSWQKFDPSPKGLNELQTRLSLSEGDLIRIVALDGNGFGSFNKVTDPAEVTRWILSLAHDLPPGVVALRKGGDEFVLVMKEEGEATDMLLTQVFTHFAEKTKNLIGADAVRRASSRCVFKHRALTFEKKWVRDPLTDEDNFAPSLSELVTQAHALSGLSTEALDEAAFQVAKRAIGTPIEPGGRSAYYSSTKWFTDLFATAPSEETGNSYPKGAIRGLLELFPRSIHSAAEFRAILRNNPELFPFADLPFSEELSYRATLTLLPGDQDAERAWAEAFAPGSFTSASASVQGSALTSTSYSTLTDKLFTLIGDLKKEGTESSRVLPAEEIQEILDPVDAKAKVDDSADAVQEALPDFSAALLDHLRSAETQIPGLYRSAALNLPTAVYWPRAYGKESVILTLEGFDIHNFGAFNEALGHRRVDEELVTPIVEKANGLFPYSLVCLTKGGRIVIASFTRNTEDIAPKSNTDDDLSSLISFASIKIREILAAHPEIYLYGWRRDATEDFASGQNPDRPMFPRIPIGADLIPIIKSLWVDPQTPLSETIFYNTA